MTSKNNFENQNSLLLILAELLEMDNFSQKKVGFLSLMKIDERTFTINKLDEDELTANLPREDLVSECIIKTNSE